MRDPAAQGRNSPRPKGKLDWEKWLGSAPKRSLDWSRFSNWYYYWDYSGGLMIGQAAHIVDSIHWLMNAGIPSAVVVGGGRPNLVDLRSGGSDHRGLTAHDAPA